MLFIQWEELCVARGLLIQCTVQHVVTEGVFQQKPVFSKSVCFNACFKVSERPSVYVRLWV